MANSITLGDVRQSAQIGGIVLTETVHAPRLRLRPHEHCNANLNVVLRGEFVETVQQKHFSCSRGSVLFKPEGARHANEYSTAGARCLAIEIPESLSAHFTHESQHMICPRSYVLASRILDEIATPASINRDLVVEGLVYELLGTALRDRDAAKDQPAWYVEAIDLIDELLPVRVSLAVLAARIGRSPAHVARVFRRVHGVSVGEYSRRRRIRMAMRQLRDTDVPIAEIALRAGFADQSHFTNLFRRITGCTPRAYRDRARNISASTSRAYKTSEGHSE